MNDTRPGPVYRRLLGYSAEYWPLLVVAVLGMMVSAATEPAFAALMKPLLDGSFVQRDPATLRWVPAALVGVFLARGIATFVTNYLMTRVGRAVIKRLRGEMFSQYLAMPVHFFDRATSGELISKITYDVEQVAEAATKSITILVRDTLTIVGLLGWMFYLSWQMTLGFLVIGPLVTGIVVWVTRRFRQISRHIQGSMGEVTKSTQEAIDGIRVVKIFGGQEHERRHFEAANERNRRLHLKMAVARSATTPIVQLFVALALAGMILFATRQQFHDTITVGTFMSFLTAMLMLLAPIKRLTEVNPTIQRGIAAGASIFEILDMLAEVDTGTREVARARGEVEFRNVYFRYAVDKPYVLKDVSFRIAPGETVALVGRSGGGKSTIANLVPRLYDVSAGQVLVDGIPVHEWKLRSLRDQVAYVGQQVTLFNDTIRNNIAYGRLANASEERIIAAAKAAYAWEFIEKLPKGLDTPVGEKGVMLSGGQRQRIAIARALLRDAPILILDEATAALDSESERAVQAALENLARDRTTLVIAHRLSTIEKADRILVVQDGRIVESGRHGELLAKRGSYANLYQLQFGRAAQSG